MDIYVISLVHAKARRAHIESQLKALGLNFMFIDAVKGSLLTPTELNSLADANSVAENPNWLTPGAIGCALSHMKAYESLVKSGKSHALILEDDALLDPQLPQFLSEFEERGSAFDLVMLYFTSWRTCVLRREQSESLHRATIYPPKDINNPITAAAYIIARESAERMLLLRPVKWAADSWAEFHGAGAIKRMGCVYPFLADVRDEKSTIDYVQGSFSFIFDFIDRYRIFPFVQLLKWRRKRIRKSMMNVSLEL